MKKLKNLFIIAVMMVAGTLIFSGSSARAQDQQKVETYDYTASQGDNLSYVVRDAINRYCGDNGEDLKAAQRMYIETNVVNDMGAYWLDVNQQVHVSKPKLKEYVDSSKNLSESQRAAWQRYADTTSIQSIIDGSKTNVATNKQAQEESAQAEQEAKNSENAAQQSENSEDGKSDNKAADENKDDKQDVAQKSWLSQNWAKIVLAVLVASLVRKIVFDKQKNKS